MSLATVCPHCSTRTTFPPEKAGQTVLCPRCRAMMHVPVPAAAPRSPIAPASVAPPLIVPSVVGPDREVIRQGLGYSVAGLVVLVGGTQCLPVFLLGLLMGGSLLVLGRHLCAKGARHTLAASPLEASLFFTAVGLIPLGLSLDPHGMDWPDGAVLLGGLPFLLGEGLFLVSLVPLARILRCPSLALWAYATLIFAVSSLGAGFLAWWVADLVANAPSQGGGPGPSLPALRTATVAGLLLALAALALAHVGAHISAFVALGRQGGGDEWKPS